MGGWSVRGRRARESVGERRRGPNRTAAVEWRRERRQQHRTGAAWCSVLPGRPAPAAIRTPPEALDSSGSDDLRGRAAQVLGAPGAIHGCRSGASAARCAGARPARSSQDEKHSLNSACGHSLCPAAGSKQPGRGTRAGKDSAQGCTSLQVHSRRHRPPLFVGSSGTSLARHAAFLNCARPFPCLPLDDAFTWVAAWVRTPARCGGARGAAVFQRRSCKRIGGCDLCEE